MAKSKSKKLPPKTPKKDKRSYTFGAGGRTYTARYPTPAERKQKTGQKRSFPGC